MNLYRYITLPWYNTKVVVWSAYPFPFSDPTLCDYTAYSIVVPWYNNIIVWRPLFHCCIRQDKCTSSGPFRWKWEVGNTNMEILVITKCFFFPLSDLVFPKHSIVSYTKSQTTSTRIFVLALVLSMHCDSNISVFNGILTIDLLPFID